MLVSTPLVRHVDQATRPEYPWTLEVYWPAPRRVRESGLASIAVHVVFSPPKPGTGDRLVSFPKSLCTIWPGGALRKHPVGLPLLRAASSAFQVFPVLRVYPGGNARCISAVRWSGGADFFLLTCLACIAPERSPSRRPMDPRICLTACQPRHDRSLMPSLSGSGCSHQRYPDVENRPRWPSFGILSQLNRCSTFTWDSLGERFYGTSIRSVV